MIIFGADSDWGRAAEFEEEGNVLDGYFCY
jgi:hypothetical protein